MIYIGIDDTDNHESRGTGRLVRSIAQELCQQFSILGVTRHQLLVDPRIPYTSHNSSAAICLEYGDTSDLVQLFDQVATLILADFVTDSDPGLCVANAEVARRLTPFGRKAQKELVSQTEARRLAETHGALLAGLGGNQDGVIGALAAVGLAACGEDGRYLLVGHSRDLSGLREISEILEAGISTVVTSDGTLVTQGLVMADKLRPSRREGRPVLYVEWQGEYWYPLKFD